MLEHFQARFGLALAGRSPVTDPRMAQALAVHRNTATKAAADALSANYPVVAALVGELSFAGLAADYVETFPPSDPRLCFYGDGFDRFIAEHPALADLSYLAEVARLERHVVEALFAADCIPLDGARIGQALDLDATLALHPAARWSRFAFPVASIWHAHQPDAAPDALDRLEWQAETVLVTRPDDVVLVTVLPDGGADFLDACRAGRTLGEAAMVDGDLAGLFAALIDAGTFA